MDGTPRGTTGLNYIVGPPGHQPSIHLHHLRHVSVLCPPAGVSHSVLPVIGDHCVRGGICNPLYLYSEEDQLFGFIVGHHQDRPVRTFHLIGHNQVIVHRSRGNLSLVIRNQPCEPTGRNRFTGSSCPAKNVMEPSWYTGISPVPSIRSPSEAGCSVMLSGSTGPNRSTGLLCLAELASQSPISVGAVSLSSVSSPNKNGCPVVPGLPGLSAYIASQGCPS